MQKKETAIEVKVGALVLLATGLLVAFVFLLGDIRFGDNHQLNVQFASTGGLKQGAEVAISGIVVGSVTKLEFIRNNDPASGLPAVAVQVTLQVQPQYADSIRQDSRFYITTRGVLGEPYVEITTPTFDALPLDNGAIVRGVDPPRMEILLGQAEQVLESMSDILQRNEDEVDDLIVNASKFFGVVGDLVGDNRESLDASIESLEGTASEANRLLATLNVALGEDGERLQGIVSDIEATTRGVRRITGRVDGSLAPLLGDATQALSDAREITGTTRRILTDNEARIVAALINVESSTEHLLSIAEDATSLMDGINEGEGTIGALLMERELYEDFKDIMRSIKQQPWRILWKE